ncbi:MAG: putative membrane protein [Clostridium sp.]|jgi:uncharacterized membrane protein
MRHGSFMGYGFYGSYILSILIILIIISLIAVLLFKRGQNRTFEISMEILKERYVREEISADEYREKRAVIEGVEGTNPALITLVERYVKGEINSEDFFIILEEVKTK